MDAAEYEFRPEQFDLIVLFYHLDRSLFPKMVSALNPAASSSARWACSGIRKFHPRRGTSSSWIAMKSCHSFPNWKSLITASGQSVIEESSNL